MTDIALLGEQQVRADLAALLSRVDSLHHAVAGVSERETHFPLLSVRFESPHGQTHSVCVSVPARPEGPRSKRRCTSRVRVRSCSPG